MSSRGDVASRKKILARIRQTVLEIEPGATVLLYGSRARGDARPISDWDVLVLLDGPVGGARSMAVYDRLVRLSTGPDDGIQSIVLSRDIWNSPDWRVLPFHQNVDVDGIVLTAGGSKPRPSRR